MMVRSSPTTILQGCLDVHIKALADLVAPVAPCTSSCLVQEGIAPFGHIHAQHM